MNRKIRVRSLLFGGLFTLFFVGLLCRVYWVQVVEASTLLDKAQRQWETDKVLHPKRGQILDRNGKVLAEDTVAYTVAVNPKTIAAKHLENEVSRGLAGILNKSGDPAQLSALQDKIYEDITRKRKDGVSLYTEVEIRNEGWKIDSETADKVKELEKQLEDAHDIKDAGIYLKDETKRSYPAGKLASHLLGYTDKEGKAVMGLESYYDDVLKGTPGSLSYESDRAGIQLPNSKVSYTPALDGKNLRLTIDKNIQFYVENTLRKVFSTYHPKALIGIAADPKTMDILGMVSLPDFDPNRYWEVTSQRDFINNAVASQFEPGSTFKLVTLAATVEEGIFHPDDKYQSGSIKVPGRTLHDYNLSGWGRISYLEGLKRSSNVAFVKLGYEMLGEDKLKQYIDKFGFGEPTGIDIAGEVPGVVKMKYPAEFATATYGQGLTVTAIQETAAYGAIANGGKLMKPHVVKQILDPKTNDAVQTFEPEFVRQVVSKETADKVSQYLETVVSDQKLGTGRKAYIDGYSVAGKTGTANIVDPGGKGYANGEWVTSFIGYAPVEDPRILLTIIAVEPDLGGDFHLGGDVAPPAFKEIVSESLRYMGVPSNDQQQDSSAIAANITSAVPQLENMSVDSAKKTASQAGFDIQVFGKGDKVLRQFPESGTEISPDERIYMITQDGGDFSAPDLSGKSLRDAMEICSLLGFRCKADGEGYVTQQAWSDPDDDGNRTLNLQLSALSDTTKASEAKKNTSSPAKEANPADKGNNQKSKTKVPKDPNGQTAKR